MQKETDNIHGTKLENINVPIWHTEITIPLAVSFPLVKTGVNLLLTCPHKQPNFCNSLSTIFYSGIISSNEYYGTCVKISLLAVSHLQCWCTLVIIIDISICRKTSLIICLTPTTCNISVYIFCICFSSVLGRELSLHQFFVKSYLSIQALKHSTQIYF